MKELSNEEIKKREEYAKKHKLSKSNGVVRYVILRLLLFNEEAVTPTEIRGMLKYHHLHCTNRLVLAAIRDMQFAGIPVIKAKVRDTNGSYINKYKLKLTEFLKNKDHKDV